MPKCGSCQEDIPDEYLHEIAEGAVLQCPPCIEGWCDDWEGEMKELTDTIRARNQEPLARFHEWQDPLRQEKQELN
ncbi:MAG: hypothetical protein O7H41_15160 [Planctomycetota bacterium]|nr:hypothetical protein [Planctomycetota bacterium]